MCKIKVGLYVGNNVKNNQIYCGKYPYEYRIEKLKLEKNENFK